MAVQLFPMVAAIVGGAVTIGTGAYIYNDYKEAVNEKPVPVISQPVKLLDGTTQQKAEEKLQVAEPLLPEFDLLRVEKDGSVLISGSAEPDSTIEIVHNDTVLGKTKSVENGDFVVVFDNPLRPGDYELYIRSTHKDGTKARSLEAAIVAIPQEGGELLAMVSKPSGPSKLIQVTKLESKVEKRAIEVPKPEEKVKQKIVENATKIETAIVQEQVAEKKMLEVAKSKVDPVKEQEVIAKVEPVAKEVKVKPVADIKTTPIEETKINPVEITKLVPQLRPEKKTDVEKIESAENIVKVQPDISKSEPAPPAIIKPVFLGAVEVEDKKIFVAGTGQPDHIVNIYIDDKFVGSAKADSQGAFLMESSSTLAFGNHTVRADMLSNTNATVVARAQVPLIHDVPEVPKEVVVVDGERQQSAAAVVVASRNEDQMKQESVKLKKTTESKIASAKSVEPEAKKLKSADKPLQVAKLEEPEPKVEASAKQLTRKLVKNDSKKVPEIVVPTKQEVAGEVQPTPVVEKTSKPVQVVKTEASSQPVIAKKPTRVIRTNSSVIIRRGDNLWRISRRILGRGIRYSTIYQANRDQIKNPSLIFPGQIFKVPEKMVDVDTSEKS